MKRKKHGWNAERREGEQKRPSSMCIFNDGPFSFLRRFFFLFSEILLHFIQSNKSTTYCIWYGFRVSLTLSPEPWPFLALFFRSLFGSFSTYFIITSRWSCISFTCHFRVCVCVCIYFERMSLFLFPFIPFHCCYFVTFSVDIFPRLFFPDSIACIFLYMAEVFPTSSMLGIPMFWLYAVHSMSAPCSTKCSSSYVVDLVFIRVTSEHAMQL